VSTLAKVIMPATADTCELLATSIVSSAREAPAGAVVATDSVSADADHDNGRAAFYGSTRYGRDDERETRRINARSAREQDEATRDDTLSD
jgi:hypothetical protein